MQLKSWFASRAYLFSALFASDRLVMRCFSRLVMGNFAFSVGILAKVIPLQCFDIWTWRSQKKLDFQLFFVGKHTFLKAKNVSCALKYKKIPPAADWVLWRSVFLIWFFSKISLVIDILQKFCKGFSRFLTKDFTKKSQKCFTKIQRISQRNPQRNSQRKSHS